MFKLLRKVVIGVFLASVGLTAFYFLKQPGYRRQIVQSAEEVQETLKQDKKGPAWSGTAVVVEAVAGDMVRVDTERSRNVLVRLAGIDAPEMPDRFKKNGQPLAEESCAFLSDLVKGKAVEMSILKTDDSLRPLVLLTLDRELVNAKVVEAGFAEGGGEAIELVPARLRHAIENAELSARSRHAQIWGLTNYVRPVEFRIRQKQKPGLVQRP
jgi:endonuclease YncB( thermonuclease family)